MHRHTVLLALVAALIKPGRSLCVESLASPGIKAIAAQLDTQLLLLPMDDKGHMPDAFEAVCKRSAIGALCRCPKPYNPMTAALTIRRRAQLAELAPELTHYVSGMSKWPGAGLRTAYGVSPTAAAQPRAAGALTRGDGARTMQAVAAMVGLPARGADRAAFS